MRINVYSQELTDEVIRIEKVSNTGRPYVAVQLVLHSTSKLHHPPMDDDRSAVTFWVPSSVRRNRDMALAFARMGDMFNAEANRIEGHGDKNNRDDREVAFEGAFGNRLYGEEEKADAKSWFIMGWEAREKMK